MIPRKRPCDQRSWEESDLRRYHRGQRKNARGNQRRNRHQQVRSLSKIENRVEVNLTRERLARLAKATGTTVGYLHGDSMTFSPGDEEELLRHRTWIDEKLATIDARDEPNATLIVSGVTRASSGRRGDMVADAPQVPKLDVPNPFRRSEVQHVLRALGDSMIEAGIANDDTLYAAAASEPIVGKIIASGGTATRS